MGTKPRRFLVFITAFVATAGLAAYFAMASSNSSREDPRPLVVSNATLEEGQMLVTIAKSDFPRTTFKKLTFPNLDTEIKYSRTTGDTTLIRRPAWRMGTMEDEVLFSIFPVPANEIVTIEIWLSESPRISLFSNIRWTNWYRWSKQF
jgi:hypothetical protein